MKIEVLTKIDKLTKIKKLKVKKLMKIEKLKKIDKLMKINKKKDGNNFLFLNFQFFSQLIPYFKHRGSFQLLAILINNKLPLSL